MHKLAKGLKKKKKPKKGKKGAEEDEFDPEELERYRRERAEAQQKAEQSGEQASNASSDEWKKFEALTAGVDSILKKTQGDLDRIKSTSFFQRKPPLENEKKEEEEEDQEDPGKKFSSKKWVGFDEEGNPIEGEPPDFEGKGKKKEDKPLVNEDGLVELPDDEDEHEDSADEDVFDTTYVDVLQNIDVQLAYIPDSPTEEEAGDDPFDTTNADKVLKTVDKKGNRLVSLGNAVEVLSGRVDYVSSCKITRGRRPRLQQDLLLDDFEESEQLAESSSVVAEPVDATKTLLDDDSDLPDIPVDLTKLPPVLPRPVSPAVHQENVAENKSSNGPLDISEFEILKEKTILEEIPDLDDAEFDLDAAPDESVRLEEADDPFKTKEPVAVDFQAEIIEASFEAATFVDEEDPFDTTFAENILPGKTELKFIEKELEELPVSEVTISLTDPAGLNRDYETGLLKEELRAKTSNLQAKKDLLGGSTTDLSQLAEEPIAPVEDLSYVDPFDTSAIKEIPPGKTELKFLEKELLGEQPNLSNSLDDDDFDPRKDEQQPAVPVDITVSKLPPRPPLPTASVKPIFQVEFEEEEDTGEVGDRGRRSSRPEVLELAPSKTVAFELPTPSKRPDLLTTTEEEKALPSKPLTPYYSQKSIDDLLPIQEEEADVDPFDTSFVAKVAPGKTELKLIESELLKQESKLPHSLSDHDFDPRAEGEPVRRQSDFTASSIRPNNLKIAELQDSVLKKFEEQRKPKLQQRQESLLDEKIEVDAKPLTPRIESKPIEEEEEISYNDPFDTSIATNILPGKAELKILESELQQIPGELPVRPVPIAFTAIIKTSIPEVDPDFDPRAEEKKETADYLCIDDQDPGAKVLTPLQNDDFGLGEDVDPFDTSFATLGPGKTELKILESELMQE